MRSLLMLLAFLLLGGVASADESKTPGKEEKPVVRDTLGLFSKPAIDEATRIVGQVRERYRIDLFIDTSKELPPETEHEKKAWFKWQAQDPARDEWAMKRAEALEDEGVKIDGIYAVIIDAGPGKRDVRV